MKSINKELVLQNLKNKDPKRIKQLKKEIRSLRVIILFLFLLSILFIFFVMKPRSNQELQYTNHASNPQHTTIYSIRGRWL